MDLVEELRDAANRLEAERLIAQRILQALEDLLRVIKTDDLISENVSYMKEARKVVAEAKGEA